MNKLFVIAMVSSVIVGCTTTKQVVVPKTLLIKPPESLYNCPGVKKPNPDTMTNRQLADYIARLYKARNTCAFNIDAIKEFVERSEVQLKK